MNYSPQRIGLLQAAGFAFYIGLFATAAFQICSSVKTAACYLGFAFSVLPGSPLRSFT